MAIPGDDSRLLGDITIWARFVWLGALGSRILCSLGRSMMGVPMLSRANGLAVQQLTDDGCHVVLILFRFFLLMCGGL